MEDLTIDSDLRGTEGWNLWRGKEIEALKKFKLFHHKESGGGGVKISKHRCATRKDRAKIGFPLDFYSGSPTTNNLFSLLIIINISSLNIP